MRRLIALVLTLTLITGLLVGCETDTETIETTMPVASTEAAKPETTAPTEETTAPTEETTAPEEVPAEEPTVAETVPVHQHNYQAVITEPTCTADGYTTYSCSCGDCYIAGQTPASHNYVGQIFQPPTCSWGGVKTYTCQACGDSYEEAVPKNEHVWGEWTVTVEPTATTYGQKVRTCTLCYGAQHAGIDPLSVEVGGNTGEAGGAECAEGRHLFVQVVDRDPTCSERGCYHAECSACGARGMSDFLPATEDHAWTDWTEWEQGLQEKTRSRTCGTCGFTDTETVITDPCKKNGHTISDADRAGIENWGDEYRLLCVCGEFNAYGKTRDEALAAMSGHAAEKKYRDCGEILREGWGHRHFIPGYNCTVCGEARGNYAIWQACDGNCTDCHVR